MKVFSRLEEVSERFIEGFFKGKDSAVQPVEIAKKLFRELESQQRISVSKVYVPNAFIVYLNPDNKEKLSSLEISLSGDLASYLYEKVQEKNYIFTGKVNVNLEVDQNIKPGQMRIESNFTYEQEQINDDQYVPRFESTQVFKGTLPIKQEINKRAELVVVKGHDEGMTFRLASFPAYVGRRKANEVFIEDVNVSRNHCLVDYINGDYFLSDLDSLNGTFVNDKEISRTKLEDGDLIKVGTTLLRFRMVK